MDPDGFSSSLLYPVPSAAGLKAALTGKRLEELSVPTAVIDRFKAKANCDAMLYAAGNWDVNFRAHVKTHKVGERNAKNGLWAPPQR
jgi:D-serine ammonia-lyase